MRASGGAQTTGEERRRTCIENGDRMGRQGQRPDRDTEWRGISQKRLAERHGEVKVEGVGRLVNRK
jgi:hypothetical protein